MRVLLLTHRYTDIELGGLAEFLHFLPLALQQHGIETIIYTTPENKFQQQLSAPQILKNGSKHYTGPLVKPRFFISQRELIPLLNLCRQEKINLIHAQGIYRAGFAAMYVHRRLNSPYVITSHSDILAGNSRRIRQNHTRRRCRKILKHAQFITHLSPFMAEAAEQLASLPAQQQMIIHNGIDINDWQNYFTAAEENYVLAIGRLETEKGFPLLVNVFAKLIQQGMQTSFIIAGTGSIEKSLHEQVTALKINMIKNYRIGDPVPSASILFTGHIKNDDKKYLFSRAKLILFATQASQWDEAFGIVQLETMAAGKALIASDLPIVRYLASWGLQVKLVKDDDQNAWITAIKDLLAQDTERQMMGQKNHRAAKQFAWDIIAKQYAKVYAQLIS